MASIDGDKALIKKLKGLTPKVEKKVCSKALRAGAKIQQKEAKADLPKITGLTRKATKVRAAKRKPGRVGINVIISRSSFTEGFYAAFPEFGSKYIEAEHNLLKAAEATQEQARTTVTSMLATGIETEAAK